MRTGLRVNPFNPKQETVGSTGYSGVCEKSHEAIVECDGRVICVYRRVSLGIPLGVLTTRRQYRVVSTSILDTCFLILWG